MSTHLLDRLRWAGPDRRDLPSLRASDIVLALTALVIFLVLAIGLCMQALNWMTAG